MRIINLLASVLLIGCNSPEAITGAEGCTDLEARLDECFGLTFEEGSLACDPSTAPTLARATCEELIDEISEEDGKADDMFPTIYAWIVLAVALSDGEAQARADELRPMVGSVRVLESHSADRFYVVYGTCPMERFDSLLEAIEIKDEHDLDVSLIETSGEHLEDDALCSDVPAYGSDLRSPYFVTLGSFTSREAAQARFAEISTTPSLATAALMAGEDGIIYITHSSCPLPKIDAIVLAARLRDDNGLDEVALLPLQGGWDQWDEVGCETPF